MIEKREMDIAKESDDLMVFVVELVKDIRAGKDIGEIAAENLQNLIDAINGALSIPKDEIEVNRKVVMATVGYRSGELADALIS